MDSSQGGLILDIIPQVSQVSQLISRHVDDPLMNTKRRTHVDGSFLLKDMTYHVNPTGENLSLNQLWSTGNVHVWASTLGTTKRL